MVDPLKDTHFQALVKILSTNFKTNIPITQQSDIIVSVHRNDEYERKKIVE